jgi:hypothetical protein
MGRDKKKAGFARVKVARDGIAEACLDTAWLFEM